MFRDLAAEGEAIAIGRDGGCQIPVKDSSISGVHALIEQTDEELYIIRDSGSTNGVLIEGKAITGPAPLMAATRIDMGRIVFIAVDQRGMAPIMARTVGEFCYLAILLWGSPTEAARHLDVGRAFIQSHADEWREKGIEYR